MSAVKVPVVTLKVAVEVTKKEEYTTTTLAKAEYVKEGPYTLAEAKELVGRLADAAKTDVMGRIPVETVTVEQEV